MAIVIAQTIKKNNLLLFTSRCLFLYLCLCLCLAMLLMATPAAEASTPSQPLVDLGIGAKVVDKSWNWDPRTGRNYQYADDHETTPEPVTWIVVAKDHYGPGSGVTLLAKDCIGRFTFDNSDHISMFGYNHWGESGTDETATHGLRPWLNSSGIHEGEGFYNAFSDSFKELIEPTRLPNRVQDDDEFAEYETIDYVFIPSATELGDDTTPSAIGVVYAYFDVPAETGNTRRKAKLVDNYWNYWTRSPKPDNEEVLHYVGINGNMDDFMRASNSHTAVRPAINLSSSVKVTTSATDGVYEILEGKKPTMYELSFGEVVGKGSHTSRWVEGEYHENSRIDVTAIPDTNWEFVKWVINDDEYYEPEVVFFMDEDKTATAHFKLKTIKLTVELEGQGMTDPVAGIYNFDHGEEVTLVATPAENWYFQKWIIGEEEEESPEVTFDMDADKTATAYFSQIEWELTIEPPEGQGTTDPAAGSAQYLAGEEVKLVATPAENWYFQKWIIGEEQYYAPTVTINMDENKTAKAYFTQLPLSLTMVTDGEGSTDPGTGEHEYVYATETEITARAAFGWQFVKWVVSGQENVEFYTNTISITMDQDKVATAYFSPSESEGLVWERNETSDTSKVWTVNFSKAPDPETVEKGTVYVTGQNGEIIPVSYEFQDTSLRVIPGGEGYIPGKLYTLWIQGLKAQDGTPLERCVKMEFTVNS